MSTEANKMNFTKAALLALPIPAVGKRVAYYDTKTRGLHLVVTGGGTKTFYLRRKHKGVSERVLIGRFPDITIENARGKAAALNSAFSDGKNPADLHRSARAELTLQELFDEYIERYAKLHTKSWQQMCDSFRLYLSHWKNRKISTIHRGDVQKLHAQIGKERGHVTANRTLELLRAVYNRGARFGLCGSENPATGITKFRIKSRDRFLHGEELARFFQALAEETNGTIRDYFFMSLLTGQRKSNVLAMRWDEIDFAREVWTIPETKNGDSHVVVLVPAAVSLLKNRLPKSTVSSPFVFPGVGRTGHLASPKSAMKRLLHRAQIADLRIHDLRRTLGSWLASNGESLVMIGKVLGHKDISASAIYSRLSQEPVRRAVEAATNHMLKEAGVLEDAEVIPLRQERRTGLGGR